MKELETVNNKRKKQRRGQKMALLATKNPRPFLAKSSSRGYITRCKIPAKKQEDMMRFAEEFENASIRVVNGNVDRSKITWRKR